MNRPHLKWLLPTLLLALPLTAEAWSTQTHKVIAVYATQNLAPKAKKQVERILGGPMADHATWLNTLKNSVKGSAAWHNIVLDENNKPARSGRDAISKIAEYEKVLRNRKHHSADEVATALKSLIHVVSDIHNPSHVLLKDVKRSFGFKFATTNNRTDAFAKRGTTTWRKFWNTTYSNRHRYFSVEWAAYDLAIYAERDKAEWSKGTPEEWAEGQGRECRPLYDIFTEDRTIGPEIINRMENIHDRGAARAALRLAALLNDIFAK